ELAAADRRSQPSPERDRRAAAAEEEAQGDGDAPQPGHGARLLLPFSGMIEGAQEHGEARDRRHHQMGGEGGDESRGYGVRQNPIHTAAPSDPAPRGDPKNEL